MPRTTRSKRTTSWSISNSAFHGLWVSLSFYRTIPYPSVPFPMNFAENIHNFSPFWVICEFDDDFGYTYLYPNMTNEFGLTAPPLADGGCDPRGCYKDEVHYNSTTIDQIEALMEVSSHCQQKIAHNCSVNAIRAGWNIKNIAFLVMQNFACHIRLIFNQN